MKDFTACSGGKRTFLNWESLLGGRDLKEHPSPPWKGGESSKDAVHSLSGLGKAWGEGQRMTRLQGQLAWLWDLSPSLHGRSRGTQTSEGRLASEDFSPFCQDLPLG